MGLVCVNRIANYVCPHSSKACNRCCAVSASECPITSALYGAEPLACSEPCCQADSLAASWLQEASSVLCSSSAMGCSSGGGAGTLVNSSRSSSSRSSCCILLHSYAAVKSSVTQSAEGGA